MNKLLLVIPVILSLSIVVLLNTANASNIENNEAAISILQQKYEVLEHVQLKLEGRGGFVWNKDVTAELDRIDLDVSTKMATIENLLDRLYADTDSYPTGKITELKIGALNGLTVDADGKTFRIYLPQISYETTGVTGEKSYLYYKVIRNVDGILDYGTWTLFYTLPHDQTYYDGVMTNAIYLTTEFDEGTEAILAMKVTGVIENKWSAGGYE